MYPDARNGISGYIEDMESHPRGAYQVVGWDDDYKALKHYRWVRNQIAHEVYADEENMCEPGDIEWLEDFYQRIMNQTDPLALDYQASKPRAEKVPTERKHSNIPQYTRTDPYQKFDQIGYAILIIGTILVLVFIAFFWYV